MTRTRIISQLFVVLLLACPAWQLYAQQAPDSETEPAATSNTETAGESAAAGETVDGEGDEAGTEASDENFVPSQQISEDLSVSFPVDI